MYSMIRRLIALVATLAVVIVVSGCAESSRPVATGKGSITGINAIATAPELAFLIEERALGNVAFKASTGFSQFDDLTYNFNFDMLLPGSLTPTRVASQSIDIVADQKYTVFVTGSIANPSIVFWDVADREWAGTETVFEMAFAHLAPSVGEVDVYFAALGTPPVLGQALGSLTIGARIPAMDFEAAAQYELILTPKDDPATILYQSVVFGANALTQVTLAIFDPDPSTTGGIAVNFIGDTGNSSAVADVRFPAQLRVFHVAFGVENVDGFHDLDFTAIIYPDVAFKALSSYVDLADSVTTLTLTPVGNSGTTIHEGDALVFAASKNTAFFGGTLADPFFSQVVDDARPIESFPVARIINMSVNTDFVNVYIQDPGTIIEDTTIPRFQGFPSRLDTGFFSAASGMREITITALGDITPIATPVIIDLANGDVVDMVIVDTVDPAMLEIFEFERISLP